MIFIICNRAWYADSPREDLGRLPFFMHQSYVLRTQLEDFHPINICLFTLSHPRVVMVWSKSVVSATTYRLIHNTKQD